MTKYRQTGHIEVHRSRRTDEVCGIVKPASASPPRGRLGNPRRRPSGPPEARAAREEGGGGPFSSPSGGFGRARPSIPSGAARRREQRSMAAELEGPRIRHGPSRIWWWCSLGVRVVVGASANDAGGMGGSVRQWRGSGGCFPDGTGERRWRRARRSTAAWRLGCGPALRALAAPAVFRPPAGWLQRRRPDFGGQAGCPGG